MKNISFSIIFKVIGAFLLIESIAMLFCFFIALVYKEEYESILNATLITGGFGLVLYLLFNRSHKELNKKEGYLLISLIWIFISIFGALPFLFSSNVTSFTNAIFEGISGFTTTGSTIITNVEEVPRNILFWRSLTQWLGGIGFILLSLALIPVFGVSSLQQFSLEIPEFGKEKLYVRVKDLALRIFGIYVLFTVLQIVFLVIGGMDYFHATNFSLTTISTGGFTTLNTKFSEFSPFIQYVFIVFMFIAGVNFILLYLGFQRKFKLLSQNEEFRSYVLVIIVNTIVLTVILLSHYTISIPYENVIREALFQTVSICSTTGYAIADFSKWPLLASAILLFLYFIGGSFGSASGGIKNIRLVVLAKFAYSEFKRILHSNAIIPVRLQNKPIENNIITKVFLFTIMYVLLFIVSIIVMTILGNSFETSMGSVASAIGNIGPGFGEVGPYGNYSMLTDMSKWFLSFLMICGRLEIFTLLMIFSPIFWKK